MSDLPDFYAGGADVILRPEWAAIQATDKNFAGFTTDYAADALSSDALYVVPAGKTLYICTFGLGLRLAAGPMFGFLVSLLTNQIIAVIGGYQGASISLSKPIAVVAGDTLYLRCVHYAASNCRFYYAVGGYEL